MSRRSRRSPGVGGLARCVLAALAVVAAARSAPAEEALNPAEVEYFEKHIRPVLVSQCAECHSDSIQAKGGLRLDIAAGPRIGGQRGQTIIPGKPEESLLIKALKYDGLRMPPGGKLDDETIGHFEEWIRRGAVDPRVKEPEKLFAPRDIDWNAEGAHWAFQPPKPQTVPTPANAAWAWNDIDRFILAKQESAGLTPARDAAKATWLRRVTVDLTGLPPTPGELLDFDLDASPRAREKVVDRLLNSPRFGERWARHWLDVSRYGESTGKERNFVYLQAWRYRNYVIDSFNQDKPYDQFVREQVAGDLLPHSNDAERDLHQVATGFLALNPKGINDRNRESFLLEIVDEQIESVSRGLMGLSVVCARCHDHKYDPVPQADYYRLAGIFRSSEPKFGILNRTRYASVPEQLIPLTSADVRQGTEIPHALIAELKIRNEAVQAKQLEVRRLRDALPPPPKPTAEQVAAAGVTQVVSNDGAATTVSNTRAQNSEPKTEEERVIARLEEELKTENKLMEDLRSRIAQNVSQTMAIGVVERPDPADVPIRVRGEVDKVGPVVPRGFLAVLKNVGETPITRGSGRLELAQWLTSPHNPLTARVYVNRVWSKLLGKGIVPTVDNFGLLGEPASHPELLDHLTLQFVGQGWSTKKLIRDIVLSRVYSESDEADPKLANLDKDNKYLWHWNAKRLEAEVLRDAVLSIGGGIDLERPQGTPLVQLGTRELGPTADYTVVNLPYRYRSVYLPFLRGRAPEMLAVFDAPDPGLTVGIRDVTSGPDQALYLLNSPLALDEAQHFARRLIAAPVSGVEERVELAFKLALGQPPTAAQRDQAVKFLSDIEGVHRSHAEPSVTSDEIRLLTWSSFSQALFALPQFRYLF